MLFWYLDFLYSLFPIFHYSLQIELSTSINWYELGATKPDLEKNNNNNSNTTTHRVNSDDEQEHNALCISLLYYYYTCIRKPLTIHPVGLNIFHNLGLNISIICTDHGLREQILTYASTSVCQHNHAGAIMPVVTVQNAVNYILNSRQTFSLTGSCWALYSGQTKA